MQKQNIQTQTKSRFTAVSNLTIETFKREFYIIEKGVTKSFNLLDTK